MSKDIVLIGFSSNRINKYKAPYQAVTQFLLALLYIKNTCLRFKAAVFIHRGCQNEMLRMVPKIDIDLGHLSRELFVWEDRGHQCPKTQHSLYRSFGNPSMWFHSAHNGCDLVTTGWRAAEKQADLFVNRYPLTYKHTEARQLFAVHAHNIKKCQT